MANYLTLGRLIKERLTDRLGNQVMGVYALGGLSDLLEGRVEAPAIYVLFDKELIPTNGVAANGREQITQQAWLVLLAVRNHGAEDMLEEAGVLLENINLALMGWVPAAGYGRLQKRSSPTTEYDGIYNIFALSYTSQVVVKGEG